jgi:hypothetical protein
MKNGEPDSRRTVQPDEGTLVSAHIAAPTIHGHHRPAVNIEVATR